MALKVLVIDDDEIDRESVRRALIQMDSGTSVSMAETGKKGMEMLKAGAFDCVFLDYILPDINGVKFLRSIYDTESDLPPVPIIMLTGQGNVAVMSDALQWGAQDYIVKSHVSKDTMKIIITKALETYEIKKSRRNAEEQLRHMQKMEAVGQLTSGIAHDFNNLLTVILGNTRITQKRLQSQERTPFIEDLLKKIQAIDKSAQRGAELVRRLTIFTRQRAIEVKVTDINDCVQEATVLLSRVLGETIEMKVALGVNLWPARIDPGQLENAIINIAVNARDAMPAGGKLTIETNNVVVNEDYIFRNPDVSMGPYVMIAISDTGVGMPPAIARRIFEPFFTTKPIGQGTGLGLSMVYGFVRQCDGYVHVYSEEGHGTVFRIYLPKYVAEAEKTVNNNLDHIIGGSETILVVDDDPVVLGIAVRMLEQLGYKVYTAESGRTALEILKREHLNIDMIFSDLVMQGGMSGTELVHKAQEYYPEILAIYTSGYTETTMADYQPEKSIELLGKPYSKKDLALKVRRTLDTKKMRSAS